MLTIQKTVSYEGTILIDGVEVMKCYASLDDGELNNYFNQHILNKELYIKNKEEIRNELTKFEEDVLSSIGEK